MEAERLGSEAMLLSERLLSVPSPFSTSQVQVDEESKNKDREMQVLEIGM